MEKVKQNSDEAFKKRTDHAYSMTNCSDANLFVGTWIGKTMIYGSLMLTCNVHHLYGINLSSLKIEFGPLSH